MKNVTDPNKQFIRIRITGYLKILHRVPVVLHKDDGVRTGQIKPQAAHTGGEQEQINAGVRVEAAHQAVTTGRRH